MRGPSAKPKSNALARAASRPAAANSAATPGCMRPERTRFRPCATETAVVRVQPHDVGHRAERDEVEQGVQPRLRGGRPRRRVRAARRACASST
jgi:hypothetical protein